MTLRLLPLLLAVLLAGCATPRDAVPDLTGARRVPINTSKPAAPPFVVPASDPAAASSTNTTTPGE